MSAVLPRYSLFLGQKPEYDEMLKADKKRIVELTNRNSN